MQYALLIYDNENLLRPEGRSERLAAFAKFGQEMEARSVLVDRQVLRPTEPSTTARLRNGNLVIADGPFAETKEQLGGLYLVDCRDLDEAIEVASKIPTAQWGSVEVRP